MRAGVIEYGEAMKAISREKHALGDVMRMSDESAVLATYFRNNVLHLFAMPSLLACAFGSNSMLRTEDLQRLAWRIYPYIASELFLRWSERRAAAVVEGVLEALAAHGLIEADRERGASGAGRRRHRRRPCSSRCWRRPPSRPSSATTWPSRCCSRRAAAQITQSALEADAASSWRSASPCSMASTRRSSSIAACSSTSSTCCAARGVIRVSREGKLEFDDVLRRVAQDAQLVLNEQIRHSILQVTHA